MTPKPKPAKPTEDDEYKTYRNKVALGAGCLRTAKGRIHELERHAAEASEYAKRFADLVELLQVNCNNNAEDSEDKARGNLEEIDAVHKKLREALVKCTKAAGGARDQAATAHGQLPASLHADRLFPAPQTPEEGTLFG